MPVQNNWRDLYAAVCIETDPTDLACLMSLCEVAIFRRLPEVRNAPQNDPERAEMLDASIHILKLRVEKLGWPDPTR